MYYQFLSSSYKIIKDYYTFLSNGINNKNNYIKTNLKRIKKVQGIINNVKSEKIMRKYPINNQ